MFFDAHCHLNEFKEPERKVREAEARGVHGIVSNSVDLKSMKKNLALASGFSAVKCALGVHPSNLLLMNKAAVSGALRFLERNIESAIAVGEIGLDFKHADSAKKREKQARYFEAQLEIAERFGKPVVVHSRLAASEAIRIVSQYECKVLFHWFSGTREELERAIELDGFFSVGPAVEFDSSARLIAREIPLSKLLTETDAPVPFRGKASAPSWIPRVVREIAMVKNEKPASLEKNIERNFRKVFSELEKKAKQ